MRWDIQQLKQLDQRAKWGRMSSEDRRLLVALIASHVELLNLWKDPHTTFDDLAPHLRSDENDTGTADPAHERWRLVSGRAQRVNIAA